MIARSVFLLLLLVEYLLTMLCDERCSEIYVIRRLHDSHTFAIVAVFLVHKQYLSLGIEQIMTVCHSKHPL